MIETEEYKKSNREEDSELGKWCASCYLYDDEHCTEGYGKIIAESEIDCLLAIYEAESIAS